MRGEVFTHSIDELQHIALVQGRIEGQDSYGRAFCLEGLSSSDFLSIGQAMLAEAYVRQADELSSTGEG